MERIHIKDLKTKIGETVLIKGFVQAIRDQGGIKFLLVRDATGLIQAVVLKSEAEAFEFVKEITLESVVHLEGKVKEEKQAPGGFELQAFVIKMLSKAEPELAIPVVTEKSGEETDITKRFDWRWLDLRKAERLQIFKVWTELEAGFRDYFLKNDFIQIYAPSFMSTPSESGADVFEVNYFDRKAYLAQSPQFYKQMAMAAGFEKVFITGPVFRAEPSFTTRHMTEFTGWDFEVSYIDSHYDVMKIEEELIIAGFTRLKEKLGMDIEVPTAPFPKISMSDAKSMLKEAGISVERELDLSPEEERELSRIVKEKFNNDFIFVTEYPVAVRPFYHMRVDTAPSLTKSFDLLYKGIEITTGAQREHRVEVLEKQATEKGMDLSSIKEYIDFFRYGCPPHGGVGMGPGRMIMRLLDLPSVKEVTFLPRDVKRLKP
ncbi:aspartate--tRNA(Asn) ligase [candidate division WWE3 bacterium RIFOXYC1_FULL_39_7]|uniref:Aspartate--tRNA(Asp/Asn) ligase n=2 Tax=Katanobacteria TaxID=422282 RepID=A0A1F4X6W8_UNCKA|nr:MAG: aspartate--tRNA(Asn) ligase [candidate division WWE3 bacterium RIFOXYC1_FULL_39_7]OGC77455.1 MAG: aspartate--tRNA(Asn) ligase [candidate division WWE3 bacterium RIFOXYD1_FULL_39_9]